MKFNVKSGNDSQSSFTVGEQVTAKFDFDHQAAGYAIGEMPFGFFAERYCRIMINL